MATFVSEIDGSYCLLIRLNRTFGIVCSILVGSSLCDIANRIGCFRYFSLAIPTESGQKIPGLFCMLPSILVARRLIISVSETKISVTCFLREALGLSAAGCPALSMNVLGC